MFKIWLGRTAEMFALVSEEDYEWACQWKWSITPNSTGRKFYATRVTETRKTGHSRRQCKIYLHKAVLVRTGLKPRSKKHTIGDHRNGNSLDCRRDNLRWATHSMNSRNRQKVPIETDLDFPF